MHRASKLDPWLQRAGFLLLPPTCVLCGGTGLRARDLCAACTQALPFNRVCCPLCALPLAFAAPACARCLRNRPAYASACVPLRYEGGVRMLLPRYKFRADLAVGRVLADILASAAISAPRPDLLAPVPLHRSRLRERGFDQAWELTRALARALELPARADALTRIRATSAQTGLDAAARRRNLRAAFAAGSGVAGLHIALVDDVVTTGATIGAAARVLRNAGAARIDIWAVARAPLGRG